MSISPTVVGTVVSIWRYPVKSMMGEELNAADLSDRGVIGDRGYALVDRGTGKIVSAKNPRKWPNLFDFRAAFAESPLDDAKLPPVWITAPDGTRVGSQDPGIDGKLSKALGRDVALQMTVPAVASLEEYWPDIEGLSHRETVTAETLPPGTFFDCAAVHLLTTATIDRLRELAPRARFEVRRFRPNIVMAASAATGFVENDWIGQTLEIGEAVRLTVTGPCPRCVMTTLAQGDLPSDPAILRTAAQHNAANVGIYAAVTRGGRIRRGDMVTLAATAG